MASRTLAVKLSTAVQSTSFPPIPQAYKWASVYKASNERPLLDMSQGVPGTPPPQILLDALAKSSSDPRSCGYCPMTGEPLMRESLAQEMKRLYGADADIVADDIALTAGCNMAFVTAVMSIADAGDELILPVPWYFNHQMTLQMLGISTVSLQTHSRTGFQPSPEECERLITDKTKGIVLVTPNNPTGAIYSPSLIASFAIIARKYGISLILDETYRDFITSHIPHTLFTPGARQKSSSTLSDDWTWRSNIVHLFSFSKSYCVPGHRLGAMLAPPTVLEQAKVVLDCLQICAPRPIQLALHPLLPDLRPFIRETAEALAHRHKLFRSLLPSTWKIGSQGGYYAFVKHPFKGVSALDVSKRLAMEGGVITLPSAFFSPSSENSRDEDTNWIRFSVANVDDEKVRKVCQRLALLQDEFNWEVERD